MYAAVDESGKIVAFHDEKKVVKCYIKRIRDSSDATLGFCKIKKKDVKKVNTLYDLYLVRYGDTYVQSGYLEYLELADPQLAYDHQYAKDVLLKVAEIDYLDKEDIEVIEKCVMILDELIDDDRKYTPSLSELEKFKDHYAPYIYSKEKG